MTAVIPQNSVLLDVNSRYSLQDPVYGNGRYTVVINNANKVNSCIKILPHRVSIPNIFPNIRDGSNLRFFTGTPGDPQSQVVVHAVTIEPDFYSAEALYALLTTTTVPGLTVELGTSPRTMQFTWTRDQFTIGVNSELVYMDGNEETLFAALGFDSVRNTRTLVTLKAVYTRATEYRYLDHLRAGQTVVIPVGTYTPLELTEVLNTNLNGLVHTIDPVTHKLSVTSVQNFYMVNAAGGNALGDMLGITTSTPTEGPGIPNTEVYITPERVQYDAWQARAPNAPNLGGEKLVHVALQPIAQGHMVAANGYEYNVLTTVALDATRYGDYAIQQAADMYTDDADFPRELTAAQVTVQLLDANYEQLYVPTNYHVNVQLKCYHLDSRYMYKN